MSSNTKSSSANFLKQGSILALASLIVRFIGMLYRIPMSNIIGEQGNGIYSVAFYIYDIVLIVSSYSIPLAMSKIISAQNAKKEYRNMGKTFKLSCYFALCSGGLFGVLLFFGADFIEEHFYSNYVGVSLPLRVLAPTVFIVAFLGVIRGFFQGKKTMIPTAVSQIIEQVANAVISIAGAYFLINAHRGTLYESAWGATGGTLGTCLGALCALLFMILIYAMYRPIKIKKERKDIHTEEVSTKRVYRTLFLTIIPIILSQTVYQISGLLDTNIFGNIMGAKGMESETVQSLIGVYSSKYQLLCSVPIAISTAMSSSMIPSTVTSFTDGDIKGVRKKIQSAIKFNMIIGIPCAVGIGILGRPIVRILFPSSDAVLSGNLLLAGCASIVFFSLSNVTGGALQSIDKMRIPVINSAISLAVHIVLVMGLLEFTNLGIYAIIIGNVTFPILVFALNFHALKRYIGYKQEMLKTFLTPIAASLWMALIIIVIYYVVSLVSPHAIVETGLSVLVGVMVYFSVFMILKGINKDELFEFPFGRKLYLLARKMRLMK